MSDIAIRVEQLGKRYRIGQREQYSTLRDILTRSITAPVRGIGRLLNSQRAGSASAAPFIWAVKDVAFEVPRGEVLGIIGANGAGKSTLLKILSRITEPTRGRAEIHGRVGSLLEVGTGFHPELTGRENVFLNGAILGMRRREINRRFDEIVGFSGVEKFIDTPVKHYSSGMYTRLAFAVAAHLLTEILLVDEVLAVGDAAFQLKCLNKMSELSGTGRTILFVSHNMEAVTTLCTRGLLLIEGGVAYRGTPHDCVERYLREIRTGTYQTVSLRGHPGRKKRFDSPLQLTQLTVVGDDGQPTAQVRCGGPLTVAIDFELKPGAASQEVMFVVQISNLQSRRISSCRSFDTCELPLRIERSGQVVCRIPRLPLVPGSYRLTLACTNEAGPLDGVYDAASIEVVGVDFYPSGHVPLQSGGEVLFDHTWELCDGASVVAVGEALDPQGGGGS